MDGAYGLIRCRCGLIDAPCTAPRRRYIVCKGAVALVDQRGSLAALVGAGEHFGERGLTAAAAPRTHRAVALRPCDVVLLSRWDLQVWVVEGTGACEPCDAQSLGPAGRGGLRKGMGQGGDRSMLAVRRAAAQPLGPAGDGGLVFKVA